MEHLRFNDFLKFSKKKGGKKNGRDVEVDDVSKRALNGLESPRNPLIPRNTSENILNCKKDL